MRVTAIQAKTERKRQDKSARCAEKHRRRAGMLRVYGPIAQLRAFARPQTPLGAESA